VELAGGKYIEVAMTGAVVDGMLVTAPAWPAHPAWLAKYLYVLEEYMTSAHKESSAVAHD
jgi:protease I